MDVVDCVADPVVLLFANKIFFLKTATTSYSGLVSMQKPPCLLTKRVKEPLLCWGKSWYSFLLFFLLCAF